MSGKSNDMTMPEDASDEYIAQHSTLSRCVVCERPMRPPGTKASDWPATVAYGTSTQCKTCYNRTYNKPVSAGVALKLKDGAKVRRNTLRNGAVMERKVLSLPRPELAARWSSEERAAAMQVCGHSANASEAEHILDMIGLFDTEKPTVSPTQNGPYGGGTGTFQSN